MMSLHEVESPLKAKWQNATDIGIQFQTASLQQQQQSASSGSSAAVSPKQVQQKSIVNGSANGAELSHSPSYGSPQQQPQQPQQRNGADIFGAVGDNHHHHHHHHALRPPMTVFPVAAPNVAVNAPPSTSGPTYHDVICSHLYHNGFGQGLYSDMLLRIQSPHGSTGSLKHQPIPDGTAFKLHRIIAIRSPYLASLLQELEMNGDGFTHSLDITIPVNDPNITTEGLSIALGHLYASFSHALLTTPSPTPNHRSVMLRSVLAASNLLHLADLASFATELIKGDVSRMTVLEYCLFVNQHEWGGNYGSWSQEIRDAVFGYLCKGVVRELAEKIGPIWGMREGESYKELVKIFADLPFEWLKKVVESKLFEVPSDMERYYFAKEVIALRSRNQPPASTLIAGEENVLLAFGANKPGTSGGVTIVRKAPKGQHAAALNGGMGVAGAVGAGRVGYAPERKIWKVQTH